MKKISIWISAHIAVVILGVCMVALFLPQTFLWIPSSAINPLLGVVMFGMGLTLRPVDFKILFTHPKDVMIGVLAQFTVMPLLACLLSRAFHLPADLAIGVILVGCCPGGTASNVITYLAKGDVALSIGMTGVATFLAPLVTPFLVYLLAGETINVNVTGMLVSIFQVVILPIVLGLLVNRFMRNWANCLTVYLPMISTLTISLIIACIVSAHSSAIIQCSLLLWSVVIAHNVLGLLLGYTVGTVLHLKSPKRTAITIEVGMQNSGLATSLAATHFAAYPLAAIPGAIFSVWHNMSGSIAASLFKRING